MFLFLKNFIYCVSPSFRIGHDPIPFDAESRYTPISVSRMRVSPFTKRKILGRRPKSPVEFGMGKEARLGIVIPYRDREEHLAKLIPMLKQTLDKQVDNYTILVVEQVQGKSFNRGKIRNVGAHYLREQCDYYCFNDVDLLPLRADYRCPSHPLRLIKLFEHTSRKIDALGGTNFGGVVVMNKSDFIAVNGYSNDFWGWGKEDDDLFARMVLKGLVPHEDNRGLFRELANPAGQKPEKKDIRINRTKRSKLLRGLKMMDEDGLNNLTYKIVAKRDAGEYQHISVEI